MSNKKLIIILVIIAVILSAFAVFALFKLYKVSSADAGLSKYSAVYLSTGDIYFGKLDVFPWPRMKNVWFLQRGVGKDNKVQLSVNQFKNVFWGPSSEIYLNPKQIVFWTKLRKDSQLVKVFENPSLLKAPVQNSQSAKSAGNKNGTSTQTGK